MSELALKLIAKAKEKHLKTLDLGNCGLTEIPIELFDLIWLEELSFSSSFWIYLKNSDEDKVRIESQNVGVLNTFHELPKNFSKLKFLKKLVLSADDIKRWKINDVSVLSGLTNLSTLIINGNDINDLKPLSALKKLTTLEVNNNEIEDISILSNLTNLSVLEISGNKLNDKSKLSSLSRLKDLTVLNLNYNKISDLSFLKELTNLINLNLSNNKISDLSVLKNLINLTYLELSSNSIDNASLLQNFKKLTSLDIDRNKLSDINWLSNLTRLTRLAVTTTSTMDIKFISGLLKLKSLVLVESKIDDISQLSQLKKLTHLVLYNNNIVDVSPLSGLINISRLYINDNKITDVSSLSKLINLSDLGLENNQIKDISPLSDLINLTELSLSNNRIRDIRPLRNLLEKGVETSYEDFPSDDIGLYGNPLEHPPSEIVEQGNEAILSYFNSLEEQGADKLNEAKLIIVGEPEAGKTTLVSTLINPKFKLSDKSKSTLGVVVKEWKFQLPSSEQSSKDFTANIWDFGGQQIQYMTHQFFLTPSAVYVLLSANDRKEATNFPYWFKIIHLLGEDQGRHSPVLVVLNEKDEEFINKFNFDLNFYQQRYPELDIKVCEVNLNKRESRFQTLRETIQTQLSQLSHVTDDRPARWSDIRTALNKLAETKDYINFSEYAEICQRFDVNDEVGQLVLSGYLHRLGSLLHFSDDPALRDFIILKPQWAADAVYSVLVDNEIAKNDGYFTSEKLNQVWKKYSLVERGNLLNLMKQENFEICYELDSNEGSYIAPQLLSDRQPHYTWDNTDSLKFRFQYKFMPEGIITRLVVRMNSLISKDGDSDLIWRKGVVLEKNGCLAQIKEEENRDGLKVIDISVTGDIDESKFLLRNVREEVQEIHRKWFKNIQAESMVPCNCNYCTNPDHNDPKFFELKILKRGRYRGKTSIECDKDFIDVSIMGLLEGVFEEKEIQQQSHIFSDDLKSAPSTVIINNNPTVISETHSIPDISSPKKPMEISKEKTVWWKQSWFSGLIGGFLTTLVILGVILNWINIIPMSAAVLIASLLGIIVAYFIYKLRSKNPYMTIAMLPLVFVLVNNSSFFSGKLNLQPDVLGQKAMLSLQWGDPLNVVVTLGLLAFSGFLFYLSKKV